MHDETPITATFQPIIQIVGLKEIVKGPQIRYRVLLNDGVNSTSSGLHMLSIILLGLIFQELWRYAGFFSFQSVFPAPLPCPSPPSYEVYQACDSYDFNRILRPH